MFNLREINQMEHKMCSYFEWELTVDNTILSNFEVLVKHDFRGPAPYLMYFLQLVLKKPITPPPPTHPLLPRFPPCFLHPNRQSTTTTILSTRYPNYISTLVLFSTLAAFSLSCAIPLFHVTAAFYVW
jgi:hypothetical protein